MLEHYRPYTRVVARFRSTIKNSAPYTTHHNELSTKTFPRQEQTFKKNGQNPALGLLMISVALAQCPLVNVRHSGIAGELALCS
jgi:hypothetical protein